MPILVETTGQFQLMDFHQLVPAHRPAVVEQTNLFSSRALLGQLKILANDLKAGTTDKDFEAFWAESGGDHALAVESFIAAFGPQPSPNPEPELDLKPETKKKV